MKINIKRISFIENQPNCFTWSQVCQHFAVEVATDDEAACFELLDDPNTDDASGDDDKCFCDYSSYSRCERLCDINCKRHYWAVVNAAVPCVALTSASCSKAFRTHRTDGMRSMAEATIIDSIRFLRYRHCQIRDFQFLYPIPTPNFSFCQWKSFQSNFHIILIEFWRRVGETAPGNKRK